MTQHKHLYRPEIYLQLQRIARKWPALDYPRFVIQAERDMNPERTNEPDDNFSIMESIRGFLSPKPIRARVKMSEDLMFYEDSVKRPDKYARGFCDRSRYRWNKDPSNKVRQIYVIYYDTMEIHKQTKRKAAYQIDVVYHYLRVMRGVYHVRQMDKHFDNQMNGISNKREIIQACLNTKAVDRAIEETLQENDVIQSAWQGWD